VSFYGIHWARSLRCGAFEMGGLSISSVDEAACSRWQGLRRSSISSSNVGSVCVKVITRLCSYFRAGLDHLESRAAAQMWMCEKLK